MVFANEIGEILADNKQTLYTDVPKTLFYASYIINSGECIPNPRYDVLFATRIYKKGLSKATLIKVSEVCIGREKIQ